MSMGMDWRVQIFSLLGQSPWIIVALGGLALCAYHLSRSARKSVLICLSLLIMLGMRLGSPFISQMLFSMWPTSQEDALHLRILINGLVYSIPAAAALALLLWGAFSDSRIDQHSDESG